MIKKQVKWCKVFIVFLFISMIYGGGLTAFGIATERALSIIIGAICAIICTVCAYRMVLTIERYARMSEQEKRLIEEYKKVGVEWDNFPPRRS